MFVSALAIYAAAQISIPLGRKPKQVEQPKASIEQTGPAWAARCKDWDDWDKPAPPVRIHADTYLVGTCGIAAILVVGEDGSVLIDGGTERGADLIAANIRRLGFQMSDIRYILHSHEHFDHVGGISRLKQLTGARVVASEAAAKVFASGATAADDPQAGMHDPFPAVAVDRVIKDGEEVRLGNIRLKAIATPGHSPGALSWSWENCGVDGCRSFVYADSLSAVSRDDYRFSDHPEYLAAFRASFDKIAAQRCEILLTPHPSASDMRDRLAKGERLLDADGCKDYAAKQSAALDRRLAKEAGEAAE